MPYFVVVRKLIKGKTWKELTREFPDEDSANNWAREMYDGHSPRDGDITVTIYKLIESLN